MKVLGKILVVTLLVGVVLLALAAFAIANIGAESGRVKGFMEQYLAQQTGYRAEIAALNDIQIYPDVVLDLDGLSLTDAGTGAQVARVAHVDFSAGLMGLLRGVYGIKSLNARNLAAAEGVFMDRAISLDKVVLEPSLEDNNLAHVMIEGSLGSQAVNGFVGLVNKGTAGDVVWGIGDDTGFEVALDGLTASGVLSQPSAKQFAVSKLEIMHEGLEASQRLLHGDVLVTMGGSTDISGDVSFGAHSQVLPDVRIGKDGSVRGDVVFPKVDVKEVAALAAAFGEVAEAFKPADGGEKAPVKDGADGSSKAKSDAIDLSALNLDLKVDLQDVLLDGHSIAKQNVHVKASKGALSVMAADGFVAEGASDLEVSVQPVEGAALHDVKARLDVDDVKVARLLEAAGQKDHESVSVALDGAVDLGASVAAWDQLKGGLGGSVTVVSEAGAFNSRWLEAWAGGLGTLILPNFDPRKQARMHCGIVDLSAQNGLFTLDHLFMDGRNVRLVGEGTYNAALDELDVKIKPKTKDISIGNISTAVNVTGSIAKPSVRPDVVDAGKKAAGLLLGAINPALLGVATTDLNLGLTDSLGVDLCGVLAGYEAGNKAEAFAGYVAEEK